VRRLLSKEVKSEKVQSTSVELSEVSTATNSKMILYDVNLKENE